MRIVKPWAYIFPVTFVVLLYANLILFFKTDAGGGDGLFWAAVVFGIINCVCAFAFCKSGNEKFLRNFVMILKYGIVPFFLIYFWMALGFTTLFTFLIGFLSLGIAGIMAVIDYLILLVGTCYMLSYLILRIKNGRISPVKGILHGICQFIFVLDVLDTMYLFAIKEKKGRIAAVLTLLAAAAIIFTIL